MSIIVVDYGNLMCYILNNMEYYHITKEKYLNSILRHGLKINSNITGFCKKEIHKIYHTLYGMQPIFLTDNIEFVVKNMLTPNWILKNKAIVLKVNLTLNNTNSKEIPFDISEIGTNIIEIQYFENIEPNSITYYKKLY